MNIWKRIGRLSLGQLFKLSVLFARNPLLIFPTLKATKETMSLCNSLFGKNHQLSTKANAFRHALWNILICRKTLKFTKNENKSVVWAQKFTDLYEKETKNGYVDEAMDLHNNKVGRKVFLSKKQLKNQEMIRFLLEMKEKAQKIEQIEDVIKFDSELVYIID